jgi:hypothetical protein
MKTALRPSLVAAALLSLACAKSSEAAPAPAAMASTSEPTARSEAPAPLAEATLQAADHTVRFEQKGACAVGAICTATIRLETKGDFHVNDSFPYKFKGQESAGVELQGSDPAKKNDFTKAAGDLAIESKTVATLTVRFKLAGKSGTVAGTYKYAICNEANCFPKDAPLSLAVSAK